MKIFQRQPKMNENIYEGNQRIKEDAGRKGSQEGQLVERHRRLSKK